MNVFLYLEYTLKTLGQNGFVCWVGGWAVGEESAVLVVPALSVDLYAVGG